MRNLKVFLFGFLALMMMPILASAQFEIFQFFQTEQVIKDEKTFFAALFVIYSAILYVTAKYSAKIPFLNWIDETKARVMSVAILLGMGYFGLIFNFHIDIASVIVLTMSYLLTTNGVHPALKKRFNWKTLKTPDAQKAANTDAQNA